MDFKTFRNTSMVMTRKYFKFFFVLFGFAIVGFFIFQYKDYYKIQLIRRLIKQKVMGDVDLAGVLLQFDVQFIPEKLIKFPKVHSQDTLYPLWAFRLSHAVPRS